MSDRKSIRLILSGSYRLTETFSFVRSSKGEELIDQREAQ